MSSTWPRVLTEAERSAILDDQIERFVWGGWRPVTRTATTAQLSHPKQFSWLWAMIAFSLCLFPFVFYLAYYVAMQDQVARLSVSEYGDVLADFAHEGTWPKVPAVLLCDVCGYYNVPTRLSCVRCGAQRR